MKNTRIVIFTGLLIAMYVIFNYILTIPIAPTLIVKFGFLPLSFISSLFGPIIGGIGGALGDVIGALSFPQGSFFPGFTLSAIISGIIYGLFLYKKQKTIIRISLAVLAVSIIVDLLLNTYWLSIMYGNGFFILLPGRILKTVIMFPIQITIMYTIWKYAGNTIEKNIVNKMN